MADDKKTDNTSEDTYNYKRDFPKTLRQIAVESRERAKKRLAKKEGDEIPTKVVDTPDEKVEKKYETEREVKVETPQVDVDAVAKKAAEEAATKLAEETKGAFKSEIQKILDKDKDLLEKQKEADALITAWDKEKRLPKDYKELINETQRITEVKWAQQAKARAEQEATERKALEEKAVKEKAELDRKQGEEKLAQFQKQIVQDLDEIYAAKYLDRPTKFEEVNNPGTQDKAAKETQRLLQFGVELNTKLVKEGKEPITSLSKIYFLHYQPHLKANPPKEQPPGADAPVSGARNTPTGGDPNKINYKQLHNETWAQTAMRLARESAKKLVNR